MNISKRLAARAAASGVIDKQDAEIYAYSYQMLFMTALLWGSALVVGLLFRQLLGMLLFMLCFVPLREYAGGIHVKSKWLCYVSTILVFALVASGAYAPFIHGLRNVLLALLPVSSIALFVLAPQEDENKPASDTERRHFKKMARIILAAELTQILVIVLFAKAPTISYFGLCGLHLCALLVIIKGIRRPKCLK